MLEVIAASLLSGAVASLITGFFNRKDSKKQILAMQETTQKNIDAQLEIFNRSIEQQDKIRKDEQIQFIKRMNLEDKKKVCANFLRCLSPQKVRACEIDFPEIEELLTQILMFCGVDYHLEAMGIAWRVSGNKEALLKARGEGQPFNIPGYDNVYEKFIFITRDMLQTL